ncbi:MAG: serine hydrolase domain-containing protein [Ginsengibacter sp.]
MHKKILFLILFSTIAFSNSFNQMNNEALLKKKLDSVFATIFKDNEPGGSVFIEQQNKILYSKSFGLSDLEKKIKYDANTVQNLGSISKTFVAYGILMLQKEGKLSIDDNLLKYFPDFKNKKIARQVTIKNLLTHTSGLPDSREIERDSIFYLTAKDEENWVPIKLTDTLNFEPGSDYEYSNPAYNGLALIIEKVSKMKWQDFIKKNIFEPAGMKNSKITDGAYPSANVAHGYRKINGHWEEYDYGEYPTFAASGNGGVWSSIEDLRKYVDAIKNCSFTDCNTITLSEEPWVPKNWKGLTAPWTGLAWFNHKSYLHGTNPDEKYTVIEHDGDQGGFRAHLIMIPEPDITIIWLTNNEKMITKPIWDVMLELGYVK